MSGRVSSIAIYAAILAVGLGVAFSGQPFWIQLTIGVMIPAMVAIAWDILSRTGQVTLGSAAFFGIGTYSVTLFEPIVGAHLAWLAAVLMCAVVAMLLGLLTLRLRKMYFAIATLGLTLSMQVAVLVFSDITGGAGGISPPLLMGGEPSHQLVAITMLLLAAAMVSDFFLSRRMRPALFLVRTNPSLAAASGIAVVRLRVIAFMVSGVLAGMGGACYGGLYGYVVPTDVFNMNWSVLPLAIAILGGMDTTLGPLLGAVLLRALEELARHYVGGVGYQVVYGAVIILFVVTMPTGVVGMLRKLAGWARSLGR